MYELILALIPPFLFFHFCLVIDLSAGCPKKNRVPFVWLLGKGCTLHSIVPSRTMAPVTKCDQSLCYCTHIRPGFNTVFCYSCFVFSFMRYFPFRPFKITNELYWSFRKSHCIKHVLDPSSKSKPAWHCFWIQNILQRSNHSQRNMEEYNDTK